MLYWLIRKWFRVVYHLLYRLDVHGLENIPLDRPFIICANHFSWWDPPLVGCLVSHKPVHFMAKEELFRMPVLGWIMYRVHAFPVRRDSADRRAIRTALHTLDSGGIIGLFPEGTRSKTSDLLPPQPGIALIALKSEAEVLPVAIAGSYTLFRPVRVKIGQPMCFTEFYGRKIRGEQLDQVAGLIMSEIGRLRREIC